MHIPGESRDEVDLPDVRFLIDNRLVQVRDRPPERNVDTEQVRQLGCSDTGRGVAPGSERHEQLACAVERQVAVHHRRDPDRAVALRAHTVLLLDVGEKVGVGGLDAGPDVLQRVCPDPVDERVLPPVGPDGENCRRIVIADQADLDARRTQLDSQGRPPAEDCVCDESTVCGVCVLRAVLIDGCVDALAHGRTPSAWM